MNFIVGTTNDDKINILQKTLLSHFDYFNIEGTSSDSEVSDQPLTINETLSGSQNRARNCFSENFNFSVGMEGGLVDKNGTYNLVCVVSFYNGRNFFTGISNLHPLPKSVSDKIKNGGEFGELIRDYYSIHPSKQIEDLISRDPAFTEAIKNAINAIIL